MVLKSLVFSRLARKALRSHARHTTLKRFVGLFHCALRNVRDVLGRLGHAALGAGDALRHHLAECVLGVEIAVHHLVQDRLGLGHLLCRLAAVQRLGAVLAKGDAQDALEPRATLELALLLEVANKMQALTLR